jgi:hypothetical protein
MHLYGLFVLKIGRFVSVDFDGYFRGAGKGKTIISNVPNLPCSEWMAVNNLPSGKKSGGNGRNFF